LSCNRHLHQVLRALSALPASQPTPPLLIHAHKSDLVQKQQQQSAATQRVTAVLERELEKRRATQTAGVGVEGLGEAGEEGDATGLDCSGGAFKFSEWEGGEVSFGEGWVKVVRDDGIVNEKVSEKEEENEDGLSPLREWLDTL
jgi:signal recognition particle receptor subunit beta